MYTESRNNFSVRSVILQFLFVALFVFILIWLFPTKSDLKKATSSDNGGKTSITESTDLSILYDRIFNENLISMKEGAQSYFTTDRLPSKNGESVILTLKEMLEKKIVLPFTDKNGEQCNQTKSYVKVTKKDNEYVMKVNLKCGEEENYLLVYMGCYDYCSKTICEKKGTTTKVYKATKNPVAVKTTKKYYCTKVNGKYYNNKGNVVSYSAYKKACIKTPAKKYYCRIVNGKYYNKNGKVVSKSEYKKSCSEKVVTKYYCRIVNGKYYDNNGNVVSKEAYKKACDSKKYYCRIVNGKYYDNNGNVVSEKDYKEACEPKEVIKYYCQYRDGKYYDDKGNIVSYTAYKKACEPEEKHYCVLYNGKYYDNNGNVVSYSEYKDACIPKKYRTVCEYKKTTEGTIKYSEWSEWTKTVLSPSTTLEVQKKTNTYKKLVGYNVKVEDDLSKPITSTETVVVGSSTTKACTKYNVTSTVTGYTEKLIGTVKLTSAPANLKTSTYRYEYVGKYNYYCTNECTYGVVYLYRVYQLIPITSGSYSCASYSTYTTAYVAERLVVTGYEKLTTKTPVYDTYQVTYYRSRTKTTTPGTVSYKWSTYNDTALLNIGYSYTGVCKQELVD